MLDLVIKNGLVVDGSGLPGFKGDVAITGGKITAVGNVGTTSARTIDARGRVIAPGFIDPHTHFDAQLSWDPHAQPSVEHLDATRGEGMGIDKVSYLSLCRHSAPDSRSRAEGAPRRAASAAAGSCSSAARISRPEGSPQRATKYARANRTETNGTPSSIS